jgi:hypothetical protein
MAGEVSPWKFGRYRVVVQRRVTEEEQISIECYEKTREDATETFDSVMESMRRHMLVHNERVVAVHQDRLVKLERMIEHRAEELRELDVQLEEKKRQLGGNGTEAAPDA